MPDNDERNPLDGWLDQQIQPLPPPPGTFELITRRARQRKLRKLAVTVSSAAVVAAGVVFVAANGSMLHLATPTESANAAGNSHSSAGARTQPGQRTAGTGAPAPTASAPLTSSAAIPPQTGGTDQPYPGPVPANFAPTSVTFVSSSRAWVIGQAGTAGSCYNGSICTSVAWTGDGGTVWHGEPAPVTGAPSGATGVSGIRFLDGVNGWAYGPELWVTHNAGNSWHSISTHGQRVTDLETVGDRAYALFASCTGTQAAFAASCTGFTLMTATANSDNWAPVSAATSGLSARGQAASATLMLTGSEGYLLGPDGTLYSGRIGGAWTKAGTAPCAPGSAQANGQPSRALLATLSSPGLAIACQGGQGSGGIDVQLSSDGGASWLSPAEANVAGTLTSFAATPGGALVLTTTSGLYTLPPQGTRWQAASGSGGGMPSGGFSYVGMTNDSDGVALPADSSRHEIWLTTNGGRTWSPSPIR